MADTGASEEHLVCTRPHTLHLDHDTEMFDFNNQDCAVKKYPVIVWLRVQCFATVVFD